VKPLAINFFRNDKKFTPIQEKLAIDGGPAVRVTPFASWPHYENDEIAAVTATLASDKVNYWTGEEGRLFETEFASFINCKHAIAVANGTVALELALYALGIGPGMRSLFPAGHI